MNINNILPAEIRYKIIEANNDIAIDRKTELYNVFYLKIPFSHYRNCVSQELKKYIQKKTCNFCKEYNPFQTQKRIKHNADNILYFSKLMSGVLICNDCHSKWCKTIVIRNLQENFENELNEKYDKIDNMTLEERARLWEIYPYYNYCPGMNYHEIEIVKAFHYFLSRIPFKFTTPFSF